MIPNLPWFEVFLVWNLIILWFLRNRVTAPPYWWSYSWSVAICYHRRCWVWDRAQNMLILGRRCSIPLISGHWSTVWIPWNWLFFLFHMNSGRIWDIFQLSPNWSIFLGFNSILPLTLNFMVKMFFFFFFFFCFCFFFVCAKNARHVCLLARTFLCILEYEVSNTLGTNKMGTGSYIKTYRPAL